jgi:CRP-like cAMP-binding protein
MSIVDIIKSSPLFFDLYDKEIDYIIQKGVVLSLESGEYIVRDGDVGDEIFILLTGHADVLKDGVTLANLAKGDFFGELVLINDKQRTADILTTSYCDVLTLDYGAVFDLYSTKPRIFSLLILNLARLLTKRLKNANKKIYDLDHQQSDKKAS